MQTVRLENIFSLMEVLYSTFKAKNKALIFNMESDLSLVLDGNILLTIERSRTIPILKGMHPSLLRKKRSIRD